MLIRCSCCQKELVNNLTLRELFFQTVSDVIIVKNYFRKSIKQRLAQVVGVQAH